MQNNFIDTIFQKQQTAHWIPYLSVLLSMFGIIFLKWDYQYIIILFVYEVFLMLLFAIIKMLFALDELPFYKTVKDKIIYLVFGIFIGIFFVVFSVMFISKSIQTDLIFKQIRTLDYQIATLTISYFLELFINYFGSQKFKSMSPMSQMVPFIQVLVILAFLQAFTGHLLPNFPNLNQAVYGIVALVLVKFFVDLLFTYFQNPYLFSNKKEIPFNQKEYITTSKIEHSSHTKSVSDAE